MRARVTHGKTFFWEMNLIISVFLFSLFYFLTSSSVGFNMLHFIGNHLPFVHSRSAGTRVSVQLFQMADYGKNVALGYALMIAISYWLRKEIHGIRISFLIAFISEIVVSILVSVFALSISDIPWYFMTQFAGTLFSMVPILIHLENSLSMKFDSF